MHALVIREAICQDYGEERTFLEASLSSLLRFLFSFLHVRRVRARSSDFFFFFLITSRRLPIVFSF